MSNIDWVIKNLGSESFQVGDIIHVPQGEELPTIRLAEDEVEEMRELFNESNEWKY